MAATAVPLRSPRTTRRRPLLRVGDERLVARVRAGDDDAFEAIYDRYYLSLLAFCRHMLGSRDEAEDALQHSFASAYTALRGGDGVIDLRPWLYTIARNRCLSALRAQRDVLSTDELELRPRALDGLAGEIQMRADLRDLIDDLQRLPDDQRAALVLFELGDQSHEQIAEVLDVRREKVKALVFQAREALLRARRARDEPCAEVRERLATLPGDVPRRSVLRSHIDRCDSCKAFEHQVRRQRAAFAAILPVAPTVGLKASVLAVFGGGGAVAAGGASTTVAGTVAAGGTTVGLASLGAKGVVTKVLAVVALAGGTNEARVSTDRAPTHRAPVVSQRAVGPATALPAVGLRAPARAFLGGPVLRRGGPRTHHSAAQHAPPVDPVAAAPAVAPAAVAPHPAPAPSQTPASTPARAQQAPAPAAAAAPASGEDLQAPAAPDGSAATSTPAAPQDAAAAAAAPAQTAAVAPSVAPEAAAPDAAPTTTSTAAPQDAGTAVVASAASADAAS
jgi:RNA polymerase sigma factor (sigma-70 family)